MKELTNGTVLQLNNGKSCTVRNEISKGKLGVVYLAEYDDGEYALRWYTDQSIISSELFFHNIINNVKCKSPSEYFMWPLALTERVDGNFGCMFEFPKDGYSTLGDLLDGKVKFDNIEYRLKAALQLAKAFNSLHGVGYCYQYVDDTTIMINPETADILMCNNDMVSPVGIDLDIKLTNHYTSPELVNLFSRPDSFSDYYALAVSIFMLLFNNRVPDWPWYMRQFSPYYAITPLFTGHDDIDRNDWYGQDFVNMIRLYDNSILHALSKTFCLESYRDATRRMTDSQWIDLLQEAYK